MNKIYLGVAVLLMCSMYCYAQKDASDKQLLDSIIKNDKFLQALGLSEKPTSYVMVNVGVGNKLFSVNNNSLNAMNQDKKINFTPSIGYFNKSGLSITAQGFLINDKNKSGFYQYALIPSYEYTAGALIEGEVSYTRFFIKDKYSATSSPIQNDFYMYADLKKKWLKPGISLGYSNGIYHQIDFTDTTVTIQNRRVKIQLTDTVSTKINTASISATLGHTFSGGNILKADDAFEFTPQFSLNTGIDKYTVTHASSSKIYRPAKKITKTRIRNFTENSTPAALQLESLGLNLDANYTIGKFVFEPQLYLDYYLPSTTEKRFTQVFSFNVGYEF